MDQRQPEVISLNMAAIILPGMYSSSAKIYSQESSDRRYLQKNWQQSKCPTLGDRMKQMMESHSSDNIELRSVPCRDTQAVLLNGKKNKAD